MSISGVHSKLALPPLQEEKGVAGRVYGRRYHLQGARIRACGPPGALKVVLLGQHDPGNYEMVIQYPHRALVAPRVRVTTRYLLNAFKKDKR